MEDIAVPGQMCGNIYLKVMRGKSSEENFDDSGVRRATVQAKAALDPKGSCNGVDCLHVHTAGGGDTKFTASGRRH